MSTVPPPPPPSFGYSSAQSRYNRDALRAQRRMMAQQARLQRDQLRMQMRASRRTSLVGPLLLVSFGIILLLLESGRLLWSDALLWLGRWWPGVLIFAGAVMLAEWALDRNRVSPTGLPPRRVLGGGTTLLLVLIALLGAGVMAADHGSAWARRHLDDHFVRHGFGDWRQAFATHSETVQELRAPLSATGSLTIDNPRGDVRVTGSSDDGQVHVTVTQRIYGWQQSEIESRRRSEQIRLEGDRAKLVLTAPSQDRDEADLTVELPREASLTLRSGDGDVTVEELRGTVEVDASSGDVQLTALSGPVHLHTSDDDATITAHSLANGLTLDGRSGDITLSEIQGPVALHGDFFGTTHLEHIRGEVRFQSSFTSLACAGIPGELNIEGRTDLNAQRLDGPVSVATTNRNLNLDGVRGGATIDDRNGSISLTLADEVHPVRITNANGSVEVGIPAQRGFTLQARTNNGQIQNEFGLTARNQGDGSELQAQVQGGGPALTLQTSEGDITVRRAALAAGLGWSDSPQRISPAPPAVPAPPRTPQSKRAAARQEPTRAPVPDVSDQ